MRNKITNKILAVVMIITTIILEFNLNLQYINARTREENKVYEINNTKVIRSDKIAYNMYLKYLRNYKYAKGSRIYDDNKWSKYSSNYYYNQMTESEKSLCRGFDCICARLIESKENAEYNEDLDSYYTNSCVIVNGMNEEDIINTYNIFKISNPQYYFLDGDCLIGKDDNNSTIVFLEIYDDFADGAVRSNITKKLKTKLNSIEKAARKSSTKEDQLKYIHDYIVMHTSYNDDMLKDLLNKKYHSQSLYSTLMTNDGICAGYAYELSALCNALDIDAIVVLSNSHAWNKVRYEGIWYNVDCTFDDTAYGDVTSKYNMCYNYYCKSDKWLDDHDDHDGTHIIGDVMNKFEIPECYIDTACLYGAYNKIYKPSKMSESPKIKVSKKANSNNKYGVVITGPKNSTIYYTTNGVNPNINSVRDTNIYKEKIYVENNTTIKAIVTSRNKLDSKVVTIKINKKKNK